MRAALLTSLFTTYPTRHVFVSALPAPLHPFDVGEKVEGSRERSTKSGMRCNKGMLCGVRCTKAVAAKWLVLFPEDIVFFCLSEHIPSSHI